ncbi:MAG: hypothetical protein LBH28_00445 [Oscillospiraceae bacterium]|jgi:hypothetical protein|nr:hypothetical protein [Oscillospiraceae bacterium]
MSAELFMRKYRVIVAGTDVSDLHCIFSISKTMSSDPNKSTLQIYNLAPKTRNSITSGKRVIIEAGYEKAQYGLIYDGDIVVVVNSAMNGINKLTQIVAQDGDLFLNSGFINVSYANGQKSIDYFNQVVGAAGGETDSVTDDAKESTLPRGKVMFGNTGDYMRQFAKNEEALFFIDDGKINLIKAADPPRGEVVSLSPESGLIGTPEMSEDGIKGKCLLNPMLKLNGLVHIDNSNVELTTGFSLAANVSGGGLSTGIYKIIQFTHTGDTRGNDWYTDFVGIAQPGIEPVTGASFNK